MSIFETYRATFALVVAMIAGASQVIAAGPPIPFKDARIKFEVNATDSDGGIQIFVDADGWKSLRITDPKGREIFSTFARGRIGKQGATELFFESAEPDFTELPLAELLERFPAGTYRFRASGLEGERMEGKRHPHAQHPGRAASWCPPSTAGRCRIRTTPW